MFPLRQDQDLGGVWKVVKMMFEKVKVLVIQSSLTLCDPVDCSPPASAVCGIFQARTLEWVAIPFSSLAASSSNERAAQIAPFLHQLRKKHNLKVEN